MSCAIRGDPNEVYFSNASYATAESTLVLDGIEVASRPESAGDAVNHMSYSQFSE